MDLLAQLIKLLGLPDGSDAATVIAAVKKEVGDDPAVTATQSIALACGLDKSADRATVLSTVKTLKQNATTSVSLASIAKAAGLKEDSDQAAIVTAVTALAAGKSPATDATVIALQSEIKTLADRLNATVSATAKDKATVYVDGEIAKGRVGVKPMRDEYITMHAANPAQVEKLIGAMPVLGPSGALQTPPANKGENGEVALNSEQLTAAKLLGIAPKDYAKTLAGEQAA